MMSSRFITNMLVLLGGGIAAVSTQAFSASTAGWITFGIAIGILGLVALSQRTDGRRSAQLAVDAATGVLAVWTIIASVVFTGATLTWLSLGESIAFIAIATAGLAAHELSTERVVHTLAATPNPGKLELNAEHYSSAA